MTALATPRVLLAGLVTVLTACAPVAPSRPEAVRLSSDLVSVSFPSGISCRGAWSPDAPRADLAGCPPGWSATVIPDSRSNILRDALGAVLQALSFDGALAPIASVVVTGPDGRSTVFVSPPASN